MGNAPSEILPRLYLGPAAALTWAFLREAGVTHVLSICPDEGPGREMLQKLRGHLRVPIEDSLDTDLEPYFQPCLEFIHRCRAGGGCCYVHCVAGISRSPAVVCAYLMVLLQLPCSEALEFLQYKRDMAEPNPAFRKQLVALQGRTGALAPAVLAGCPADILNADLEELRRVQELTRKKSWLWRLVQSAVAGPPEAK